jgi:hypothetical protein
LGSNTFSWAEDIATLLRGDGSDHPQHAAGTAEPATVEPATVAGIVDRPAAEPPISGPAVLPAPA